MSNAGHKNDKKPVNWKTNLFALWLAQFLSLSAFSFSLPFFPLYLKDSGIVPADEVSGWSGFFISAASISMMIMSPIWGSLGDRYGRKMMLVRANLGGAFALYLMGVTTNIEGLVVLRFLQGAFTGTVPAAQTLVATNTPDRKQGFAIGVLMAAVNAGNLAGAFFGGMAAQAYGPAVSFKISGFMLLAASVLVLVAVRENFDRPVALPSLTRSARIRRRREQFSSVRAALPFFIAIAALAFIQTFDGPFLSLYVESVYSRLGTHAPPETITAAYGMTGIVSAVASVAAIGGSIVAGIVMDRKVPGWVWAAVAGVAGLGAFGMAADLGFVGLGVGRFIFSFAVSGLASVMVVVLGRLTPPSKTGGVFGWSTTVRSLGWIFAPLAGAQAARLWGEPVSFGLEGVLCVALVPLFFHLHTHFKSAYPPDENEPPSIENVGSARLTTPPLHGRMT